jgi:putative membrane protein
MTKQWKYAAAAVSCAFVCAGLAAFAAAPPRSDSAKSSAKTTTSATKMSDSDFAKTAAEGGLAEVKFGELAEDKAASKPVKELAQRMVDDHTKADDTLKTAATNDNISIPAQMNAKDQAAYARLSELSGAAFDRAYARDMVRDHETDIALFRHEANDGKDASIKSFAAQTLPTLEDHLKLARQALQSVSPKTKTQTEKKQS